MSRGGITLLLLAFLAGGGIGFVAGSGGYYIACPGRRIFAQPTTITGSIGVIGMFQNVCYGTIDISNEVFQHIRYRITINNHVS